MNLHCQLEIPLTFKNINKIYDFIYFYLVYLIYSNINKLKMILFLMGSAYCITPTFIWFLIFYSSFCEFV